MKLLVCGGRDFENRSYLRAALDFADECARAEGDPIEVVIQGAQRKEREDGTVVGADWLAREWALDNGLSVQDFPADWRKHGRAAGPIRNQQMIDIGEPDAVIAFPGGRGTADMVRRARAAGIPTKEMKPKPAPVPPIPTATPTKEQDK